MLPSLPRMQIAFEAVSLQVYVCNYRDNNVIIK